MDQMIPSGEMRGLAQRLLAHETAILNCSERTTPAVIRVNEKLRASLIRLAGAAGFRTLLTRALIVAKMRAADTPGISEVQVMPNGSLEGLDAALPDDGETAEAGLLLIAQLLELLVVFIGEHLVLRLLSDVWPGLSLVDSGVQQEAKNDPTR
jgi:hypothetical protein